LLRGEQVTVSVISDSNHLLQIEREWNQFVRDHGASPFCLSEFVRRFLGLSESQGWTAAVLVFRVETALVGVAPLIIRRMFGIRFARSLLHPHDWCMSDFIFEDRYREDCVAIMLDFVLTSLGCQTAFLTLPGECLNLQILRQKSCDGKVQFFMVRGEGRRILPVECEWAEFEKSKGRRFRKEIRHTEEKLKSIGSLRVVEKGGDESETLEKILAVERRSWKEEYRTRRGMECDPDLPIVWEGSRYMASIEPNLRLRVFFLELNEETVAYSLFLQYRKEAINMKTSYDKRYKRYYAGKYITHMALRELFNKHEINRIDFVTDLPFLKTWTDLSLPRVTACMCRKGLFSLILKTYVTLRASAQDIMILRLSSRFVLDFLSRHKNKTKTLNRQPEDWKIT
jgi:hypothetical protein